MRRRKLNRERSVEDEDEGGHGAEIFSGGARMNEYEDGYPDSSAPPTVRAVRTWTSLYHKVAHMLRRLNSARYDQSLVRALISGRRRMGLVRA